LAKLPTEQPNARAKHLHLLQTPQLVDLFIHEEKSVEKALQNSKKSISEACHLVTQTLKKGGRVFYVGAGTSGRLGVLDASELPPTFGLNPNRVQGIIAGGEKALTRSIEGAEDSPQMGAAAIRKKHASFRDIVIGITASGRTPFVLGALKEAQRLKIKTIILTCNPDWKSNELNPAVNIHLKTGPEIIAGSTRLKAGTATKTVLNMLSSIAMIRCGYVHGPWMTHVQPNNEKLRARSARITKILKK
jgi:N-acetylmuramic acid 6-phosphate etherase